MANEALIRVGKSVLKDVQKWLALSGTPTHIHFATDKPMSLYGYTSAETHLLKINEHGIVMGAEGDEDVPREFIPWQNIAFVADGTKLYASRHPKGATAGAGKS
jgi:hypothetical protein